MLKNKNVILLSYFSQYLNQEKFGGGDLENHRFSLLIFLSLKICVAGFFQAGMESPFHSSF